MTTLLTRHSVEETLDGPVFHGVTRTNPKRTAIKAERAARKKARRAYADKVKPQRGPRRDCAAKGAP